MKNQGRAELFMADVVGHFSSFSFPPDFFAIQQDWAAAGSFLRNAILCAAKLLVISLLALSSACSFPTQ